MSRVYFNKKATIWDEAVAEKASTKLEHMAESLDIEPGSAVLDVGTGTGVFVPYLMRRIGKHGLLVTLDYAEEMLKIARAKGCDGNVEYLQADVSSIPLGESVFDAVVCYSSFPHFQDKARALVEIMRVLKQGSKLFICHTSNRFIINDIHNQIPAVQNDILPDQSEMYTMLSTVGFAEIDIRDCKDSYFASTKKPRVI